MKAPVAPISSDGNQNLVKNGAPADYDKEELAERIQADDSLTDDQKLRLRWKIQELLQ